MAPLRAFTAPHFLLLKVVPGEASSSDLSQNWQRHYRLFLHEEMRMVCAGPASSLNRAATWNLDGTSLMFIPWHFEDRRYSQEMTTMTPGYTISDWNRFHGKLYVALVFPSPGIFIRRRARLVAMRRRNGESSMRHLPMCQVSWLYWACAMAPTVQSTHRADFWFITCTKVCTSELVQDDNAQTCMQLVGGNSRCTETLNLN